MIVSIVLVAFSFVACFFGTRAFIGWSRRNRILDIPNERSSHTEPVPVGAGLIISSTVLLALSCLYLLELFNGKPVFSHWLATAFLLGSIALVAISWQDDIKKVPVWLRFLAHSVTAAAVLWFAPGWISGFGEYWLPGLALSFLWIVGLTNAYNFMDGIDGISGVQAITAGVGWGAAGIVAGLDFVSVSGLVVAGASLAFLFFNWDPAKVFMGDSGSAFLGFTFACLPIFAVETLTLKGTSDESVSWIFGMFGVALTGPFVIDSTMTFLKRLVRGEKVWEPHRSHYYQAMVIGGDRHSTVALIYAGAGVVCSAAVLAAVLRPSLFYLPLAGLTIVAVGLPVATLFRTGRENRPGETESE